MKNALDWASRPYAANPLPDKPVAVIGASPSPRGPQRAQHDLRRALSVVGADVLDAELAVAPVHLRFDQQGTLADGALKQQLQHVFDRVVERTDAPLLRLAG